MNSLVKAVESFKSLSDVLLQELRTYLEPYRAVLPDARFRETVLPFVAGMLAAGSPQISQAAAHAPGGADESEALAKRIYRLLPSERSSYRDWVRCLYADARRTAKAAAVERLVVAGDPVNFEKADAQKIEGISQVYKSTPPGSLPAQPARITNGYPSILAQVVNLGQVVLPYAHLFSYTTADFMSENQELKRALRTIRTVLWGQLVCIVADAGLGDQKLFRSAATCDLEFVIRAATERNLEVYNPPHARWEAEKLLSLAETFPGRLCFETHFTHAGDSVTAHFCLDWFQLRLPATQQLRWAVVAMTTKRDPARPDSAAARWLDAFANPLVLLTNRPGLDATTAQQVYADWHLRPGIEHLNRFIQEDGLDVERSQRHRLERFRRELTLVLAAVLFVLRRPQVWHSTGVRWLRQLGSALAGTAQARGGPYLLLRGVQRVLSTLSVLATCAAVPPPTEPFCYQARAPA